MEPARLRLGEFAKIVGEPKETIRTLIWRGEAPFPKEPQEGAQRTYDGADLLAWMLFTRLRDVGVGARLAGETVLCSDVVQQFFDRIARNEGVSDFHLVLFNEEHRDKDGSIKRTVWQTTGASDDIAAFLKKGADLYGQETDRGRVLLGIPALTAVAVRPCHDRCCAALLEHGFVMNGATLLEA